MLHNNHEKLSKISCILNTKLFYIPFFINYNLYLYSTHINDRNIKIYLFINKTHLLNTKIFFY
jgi:hypothetical protein